MKKGFDMDGSLTKTNFVKSYQLLKRLHRVVENETRGLDIFGLDMSFEKFLGYGEQLVCHIPTFALNVLEKISDKDIVIATRTILWGLTHCPKCFSPINTMTRVCQKCNTPIPKEKICINHLNKVMVSYETKKLLSQISGTELNTIPEQDEIIASLVHEVGRCPDCGMEIIPPNSNFCWNCGSRLEKNVYRELDEYISVSLPLDDICVEFLNKIATEKMKEIDEFSVSEQVYLQDFCDVLIDNEIASAKLCKKLGDLCAKLKEYEDAVHYYTVAMDMDFEMDLSSRIEKLEKKIYR